MEAFQTELTRRKGGEERGKEGEEKERGKEKGGGITPRPPFTTSGSPGATLN